MKFPGTGAAVPATLASMRMRARPSITAQVVAVAALLMLGAVACSDGAPPSGQIRVTGAWARTTVAGQTTGAVYFTIRAGAVTDDLTRVSVSNHVAGSAMLHRTMTGESGGDMPGMDMGDDDSMSSMEAVHDLEIASGTTVRFQPGSYHVMLMDLTAPLERGTRFTLTLAFRHAGEVVVPVTVRDRA